MPYFLFCCSYIELCSHNIYFFMLHRMTSYDKSHFPFNLWSIEWEDFFSIITRINCLPKKIFIYAIFYIPGIYTSGLRLYIMKETLDTLNDARRKYRRMTIIHYLMLFCILTVVFYCGYKILKLYGILDDIITEMNVFKNTKFTFLKYDMKLDRHENYLRT